MNSLALMQGGYSRATPYTPVTNNTYDNGNSESNIFGLSKQEKLKHQIRQYAFLYNTPRSWLFKMHNSNEYQRKKVSDMPKNLQDIILKIDKLMIDNRKTIEELSFENKEIQDLINKKMHGEMKESIQGLKLINVRLVKTTNKVREVADYIRYYETNVERLKNYVDMLKSNRAPIYTIPS